MDPLELSGLIASRMAHDFAGPVSAMENGAALLADEADPAVRAEFTAMLGKAAGKLAARLRLYRLMFGAGRLEDAVPVAEARAALKGLLDAESHVVLHWQIEDTEMPRARVKLLLTLAVLCVEALPRGGVLSVAGAGTVHATGARAAFADDILAAVNGEPMAAGSRAALAVFGAALAVRLGLALTLNQTDGRVAIVARAPQV